MANVLLGAIIALAGSIIGGLWLARLELVREKRKYLYEIVLPALRPEVSAPLVVIERFDELRRLGRLLTRSERRLVDRLMDEHRKLGDSVGKATATDRYGGLEIRDRKAYDAAVAEFESHRADLEAEMARRLRRWI
jgi:hypothetical protein